MNPIKLSILAQDLTEKLKEAEEQRLSKNKKTLNKIDELTEKVKEFKQIKKIQID